MPTHDQLARFLREYSKLDGQQKVDFSRAVRTLILFLITGIPQPGLRLKKLQGTDTWEITWAPDGRATFHYGEPVREGHQHIVWRRIGTHDILRDP